MSFFYFSIVLYSTLTLAKKTHLPMVRAYRIFNALSLDVAVGACGSAAFVAHCMGVSLTWATLLALGLCVWIIYTLDHLIDASTIKHRPHTFRHWFHQRYFKVIAIAVAMASVAELVLLQYLPRPTLIWGFCLSLIVLIYFLLLRWLRPNKMYHKEFLIAVVYTAGVFLPSLSIVALPQSTPVAILFIQFFLVALSNLLIFSVLETKSDSMDQQTSLATVLGEDKIQQIVWLLLIVGVCIAIIGLLTGDARYAPSHGALLMINVVLSLILIFPSWQRSDYYRFIGDGAFFIPLIFVWLM